MVIISAAICDKSGGILIARQCQKITRHQLEESLRNFPKLISADQQHTFVETEYVRYVFLPLDNMYLVLLTKKNSNIIEDQETIRLLHKIVQELCPSGVSEANILKRDFDILLCFDDVISFGLRESVSLIQVQSSLEMESAEEKLHIMLMKQKQAEQNEAAKRHQLEVQKKLKSGKGQGTGSNSISSSSYGSLGSDGAMNISSSLTGTSKNEVLLKSKDSEDEGVYRSEDKPVFKTTSKPTTKAPKKGLVLGKKNKAKDIEQVSESTNDDLKEIQNVKKNENISQQIVDENKVIETKVNPLKVPVEIEIVEKVSCNISREGTLSQFEVNGEIMLQFMDPARARVAIQFQCEDLKLSAMKPHINLNKQLWMDKKQIALKSVDTSFPIHTRIPSVKYRYSSTDQKDLPFILTYWFSEGSLVLEVEYNTEQRRFQQFEKLRISFCYPSEETPIVTSTENAEYESNSNTSTFTYIVPILSSQNGNSNIQIAFSSSVTEDDIFPLEVNFLLASTFLKITPLAVANLGENNSLLKFDVSYKSIADKYFIN